MIKTTLNFKNESELIAYCKQYSKQKEEYNGWSNYATWRVNLEMVNGSDYVEQKQVFKNISELADRIKEDIFDYIELETETGREGINFARSYAEAFLSNVNWYEIAENMAEDLNIIQKLKDKGHIQQ